jgi:UDP-N-acetylglucosamine--N-acetylmuramyl-(pentapeptide) pyrophosphoryl-undecaprenol N-acetylglucosamine transferase
MARSLRVVCYAINGAGVGHLVRLTAVSRWMRRYAAHAGARIELVFLASSEADGALFAEDLPCFKVPSKTAMQAGALDKTTWIALAKQWVWHSLGLLRPDLLVVDTFPEGSFRELPQCLDLCKKSALVHRPVKPELASRPDFQLLLGAYDRLLVPELDVPDSLPPALRARARATGPIASRERVELATRPEARAKLDLPADAHVVWVSAGGGGDPGAERDLEVILHALTTTPDGSASPTYVVVTAGPLHRGAPRFGPRLRWLTGLGAAEWLRAADVAVTAAGYNTVAELALAGVPAALVPQEKVADEQDVRARRAVDAGAAMLLPRPLAPELVRSAVAALQGPGRAEAMASLHPEQPAKAGARTAAAELLRLVLPASEVDAAVEAYTDDTLALCRELRVPDALAVHAMHLLEAPVEGMARLESAEASREAARVLRAIAALGAPLDAALRALALPLGRLERGTPRERADAALRLTEALAPFGDWQGAEALLRLAAPPRHGEPLAYAADLARLLATARQRGDDVYRAIESVVRGPRPGERAQPDAEPDASEPDDDDHRDEARP